MRVRMVCFVSTLLMIGLAGCPAPRATAPPRGQPAGPERRATAPDPPPAVPERPPVAVAPESRRPPAAPAPAKRPPAPDPAAAPDRAAPRPMTERAPGAPLTAAERKRLSCTRDSDCVLSSRREEDCCDDPCFAHHVHNRSYHRWLGARTCRKRCTPRGRAHCPLIVIHPRVAACEAGRCVSRPLAPGQDPDVIRRIVRRSAGAFQTCYRTKGLAAVPGIQGTVVLSWSILGSGQVSGARIESTTLRHGPTEACLLAELRKLRFPGWPSGRKLIRYPLTFVPPPR